MSDSAVWKTGARDRDVEEPSPRRSRAEEEFALLMTVCARVAQRPPPAPPLPPSGARGIVGPADFWRRVDRPVTETAPASATRFVTQIVHKELGPMEVVVERNGDAVRVVFGVADAVAKVALETQRASLLEALHVAGVRVASVVVSVRAGGIPFAPSRAKAKPRSDADEGDLDLVG
jgi:hypothetical protein